MGLDYILNIYCYSESHASCEANHQVNKTINARRGVGAWRVVLKSNLRQELTKLGQCLAEISLSVCTLRLVHFYCPGQTLQVYKL